MKMCARTAAAAAMVLLSIGCVGTPAAAADEYSFNRDHSEIRFIYSHAGVSDQSGEFTSFTGTAVFDEEMLANSSVTMTIDTASVTTGVTRLDGELKNPYYFSATEFPTITFESTEVRRTGSVHAQIIGNLTIRDVTMPITLNATLRHKGEHPLGKRFATYKGQWLGIHAETSLLRSEFGLTTWIPLVSDHVTIVIDAELKKRK